MKWQDQRSPRRDDSLKLFDFVRLENKASEIHSRGNFVHQHPLRKIHRVGNGQDRQQGIGSFRPFENTKK